MKRAFLLTGLGLLSALSSAQQAPVINEFVLNHVGTDSEEFIELFVNSAGFNFANFQLIAIEGDAGGAGVVDNFFQPGVANAGGFWTTPFLGNLENGSITLLLVTGFSGTVGNDLDTDNNGVFDVTPWSSIVDSVGVFDGTAGDWVYSPVILTPTYDGGTFTVGGASRIPNGVDTDLVSDWIRNDFDGFGLPSFSGTPTPGEAINTPNAINAVVPVPEPTTVAALGLGALALIRRRRNKK